MKLSELPDISPMLPKYIQTEKFLPRWGITYTFEPKYDGFCCIIYWTREDNKVIFSSRTEKILRDVYPRFKRRILEYFAATKATSLILQGEIIAWDKEHPTGNLGALQLRSKEHCALRIMAFDLLFQNRVDLREKPYFERRRRLQLLLKEKTPYIKIVPSKPSTNELPKYENLEGHVVKNVNSFYVSGKTSHWLKLKPREGSDFIVTGCTPGLGACEDTFGSLELSEFKDGKFVQVGHVGTGFTFAQRLIIKQWIDDHCKDEWRYFTVEVTYPRRTSYGQLWHPVFLKLKLPGE